MSLKKRFAFVLFAVIVSAIIGCSGNGTNPVSPTTQSDLMDSIPIIGMSDSDGVVNSIGVLGAYDLYIDKETMTAELTPIRTSTVGEDYVVSGMGYWIFAPCANCLRITGVSYQEPYIGLDFKVDHPFDKGNTSLPPTGKNRLDLDIFDLALVIRPVGWTAKTYPLTGGGSGTKVYADVCGKADGYTTELSGLTTDPAACPFFLVLDESDSSSPTNNRFEMGTKNVDLTVYFITTCSFNMYLTMGYGSSAVLKDRLNPKYFVPEFNRKPAWKINVIPPNGSDPPSITNTWNSTDTATTFPVAVEAYDWQQGATVYSGADYSQADPDEIFAASEVSQVSLEIPGMFTALKTMTTADSGTGMPLDPLVYTFDVANENGLISGTYLGLVKVRDERLPKDITDVRDFLVDCPDGINRSYYNIIEYAAYQIFEATVVEACGPIAGSITTPTCPLSGVYDDSSIHFVASASSANGGDPIILYEWDQDYDGATFDVDKIGDDVLLGPFDNPNCGGTNDPVTYTVAVRATDSCTPPNVTVFATCEVTVDICITKPISSRAFVPKDVGDTYYDICVAPTGPVYMCADHPATGNTDGTRTALRFTNDLTNEEVINSGTGMNDPDALGMTLFWNRIDVTDGGFVVSNPGMQTFTTWQVSGTTATQPYASNALSCGSGWVGDIGFTEVWNQTDDGTSGSVGIGYTETNDCDPSQYGGVIVRPDSASAAIVGGIIAPPMYTYTDIVGIQGSNGTDNAIFFISSASTGKLSISGSWTNASATPAEVDSTGTLGTGDGEFTGGLDLAVDSAGNIVTLEDHGGGIYRFQKFDSALTWIYTSAWSDDGNPMRMDFDTDDNELYLISSTGIHIMHVQ